MAQMNLLEAIRSGLEAEMALDERVIVFGEDVGKAGGVFLATQGLQERFGEERVFDTPLAESGILGMAVGMALAGLRPVPEIQFVDFIYPGFDQIVSEMAKVRYRSGGQFTCPLVVRTPYGGGVHGGLYHSQSPETYFVHTAGLKVVIPSTPYDAKGLLIAAIRDPDPVLFLEPKKLYRDPALKEEVPEAAYTVPLGTAKRVREGSDVAILTYGTMVHRARAAAEKAAQEGIQCRVVDLRTLMPFDRDEVLAAAREVGRVLIVHEAPKTVGFGAELAAFLAEEAIEYLEAPVVRVTGFDTPYPYALDDVYLVNEARILNGIRRVARW